MNLRQLSRLLQLAQAPKLKRMPAKRLRHQQQRQGSPVCGRHRCHMKFAGHEYHSGWCLMLPTWRCPVQNCSEYEQRISAPGRGR